MSSLSSFTGNRATQSVVSAHTTAGVAAKAGLNGAPFIGKTLASGALTANTLKSMLSVSSGGGVMRYLSLYTADATSRTLRIKVTLDGVVAVDVTSAATASSGSGLMICGLATNYTDAAASAELRWNRTLTIEIASSLSETDKLTMGYAYNLE